MPFRTFLIRSLLTDGYYPEFYSILQRVLNDTIVLQLLDDSTPEEREEYRVILSNIQTKGKILNH